MSPSAPRVLLGLALVLGMGARSAAEAPPAELPPEVTRAIQQHFQALPESRRAPVDMVLAARKQGRTLWKEGTWAHAAGFLLTAAALAPHVYRGLNQTTARYSLDAAFGLEAAGYLPNAQEAYRSVSELLRAHAKEGKELESLQQALLGEGRVLRRLGRLRESLAAATEARRLERTYGFEKRKRCTGCENILGGMDGGGTTCFDCRTTADWDLTGKPMWRFPSWQSRSE